jgi:hypothetical protein
LAVTLRQEWRRAQAAHCLLLPVKVALPARAQAQRAAPSPSQAVRAAQRRAAQLVALAARLLSLVAQARTAP